MNKILNEENLNKVHQGVALIEKLAKENIFDFILFVQDRITDFSRRDWQCMLTGI